MNIAFASLDATERPGAPRRPKDAVSARSMLLEPRDNDAGSSHHAWPETPSRQPRTVSALSRLPIRPWPLQNAWTDSSDRSGALHAVAGPQTSSKGRCPDYCDSSGALNATEMSVAVQVFVPEEVYDESLLMLVSC